MAVANVGRTNLAIKFFPQGLVCEAIWQIADALRYIFILILHIKFITFMYAQTYWIYSVKKRSWLGQVLTHPCWKKDSGGSKVGRGIQGATGKNQCFKGVSAIQPSMATWATTGQLCYVQDFFFFVLSWCLSSMYNTLWVWRQTTEVTHNLVTQNTLQTGHFDITWVLVRSTGC